MATIGMGALAWHYYDRSEGLAARAHELERKVVGLEGQVAGQGEAMAVMERENVDLAGQLTSTRTDLGLLTDTAGQLRGELANAKVYRDAVEDQLREFDRITRKFRKMIDAGRLKVTYRKGRMMLELPASVLFDSGSAELRPDGRVALSKIAKILRRVRGRRFIVAGHTDNVPVRNDRYPSNWELSADRGVTVVRALIHAGVRRARVAAAGFADTDPVASNRRDSGRQSNRRIEIIIEPHVAPLPKLERRLSEAKSKLKAAKREGARAQASTVEASQEAAERPG